MRQVTSSVHSSFMPRIVPRAHSPCYADLSPLTSQDAYGMTKDAVTDMYPYIGPYGTIVSYPVV